MTRAGMTRGVRRSERTRFHEKGNGGRAFGSCARRARVEEADERKGERECVCERGRGREGRREGRE